MGDIEENPEPDFVALARKALFSRRYTQELIEDLNKAKKVRGILLYGNGLNCVTISNKIFKWMDVIIIKAVNSNELIKNSFEETERSVHEIFRNAISDERELGEESLLHVIVIGNFEAIFGAYDEISQYREWVKNYILNLLDGENQLNNILVIGVAEKLENVGNDNLKAGRFEVQIEFGAD